MSALAVFAFGEQVVRVTDRDGSPWFVGRDVCEALGLASVANALKRLPTDEKGVFNLHTLGGNQEVIVISEAGMYRLVLTSRTEPAERFKTWVVSEVLPSIRRTGSYEMPLPANDQALIGDLAAAFTTEAGIRAISAKLQLVRTAGATFGVEAAREAWRAVALPDVAEESSALFIGDIDEGLKLWFAERCETDANEGTAVDQLYGDYLRWCRYFGGRTPRDRGQLLRYLTGMGIEVDVAGTARRVILEPAPSMAGEVKSPAYYRNPQIRK